MLLGLLWCIFAVMKTTVNIVRKLEDFDVVQRSSDGMFNATALVKQWNIINGESKEVRAFLRNDRVCKFIDALKLDILAELPSGELSVSDIQVFITHKGKQTKTGKTPDTVWMHPLLFLKFAMWINPEFEVKVLRFVYDQLVELRNNIGDNHNDTMFVVSRFVTETYQYAKINEAINYIAIGTHYKGIRNTITQEQAKLIHDVQDKIKFSVEMGFVKSYAELITMLRDMYQKKLNNPF